MHKMEYIKCFWKYIDKETPILIFYELDLDEERYATMIIDIFPDRHIEKSEDKINIFVSEAPCPTVEEINKMDEFKAFVISKQEFEVLWSDSSQKYKDSIGFPDT